MQHTFRWYEIHSGELFCLKWSSWYFCHRKNPYLNSLLQQFYYRVFYLLNTRYRCTWTLKSAWHCWLVLSATIMEIGYANWKLTQSSLHYWLRIWIRRLLLLIVSGNFPTKNKNYNGTFKDKKSKKKFTLSVKLPKERQSFLLIYLKIIGTQVVINYYFLVVDYWMYKEMIKRIVWALPLSLDPLHFSAIPSTVSLTRKRSSFFTDIFAHCSRPCPDGYLLPTWWLTWWYHTSWGQASWGLWSRN